MNNFLMAKSIKTPQLSHIKCDDWNYIYEPAEDTFLLMDALEKDLEFIYSRRPGVLLEIGSGSGVVITALSQTFHSASYCMATDINPYACKITSSTALQNSAPVDVIQADLTFCLKNSTVDMIVFNPPYVVTPSDEINSLNYLARSWAGGIQGREVIDRFLHSLNEVMSESGFGYLLLLKENQPFEVIACLEKELFTCKIIAQRKIRSEELFVIKFAKHVN